MPSRGRDIVVIGTSAGGLEAVDNLLSQLPNGLSATVFVVQHLAPQSTAETLLPRLKKHKGLKCSLALNGKAFQRGRLYIARPDYHLLIKGNKVLEIGGFRSPQEGQTVEFDVVKGAQRLPGRKRPI